MNQEQSTRLRTYLLACYGRGEQAINLAKLRDRIKRNKEFRGQKSLYTTLKTIVINDLRDIATLDQSTVIINPKQGEL